MTDLPAYISIVQLVALVGFGATLYAVLNLGARAAGASRRNATALAARVPAVARALADRATPARLALPQTWRIVGVVFLILMVTGDLPAVFAVPAGLGDIAIGIAAPFIARRLATGNRRGAIAFNVLGIVDLVAAVTLGVLAAPGPLQLLQGPPSTEAMTLLPLALIPTVMVPICIALHILSLHRLSASNLARQEIRSWRRSDASSTRPTRRPCRDTPTRGPGGVARCPSRRPPAGQPRVQAPTGRPDAGDVVLVAGLAWGSAPAVSVPPLRPPPQYGSAPQRR